MFPLFFEYIVDRETVNVKLYLLKLIRGTQRQFSENICSEDDLRSRILGTFVVKCIACLVSPRLFEHPKNGIIAHFLTEFFPLKGHLEFSGTLLWLQFRKGKF